ncbi:MAG TPA: alpha/beta hydrolase [Chloroflexi bacterium]|nr:alpha/beta hydrolase [Chloroflexota bacterium]
MKTGEFTFNSNGLMLWYKVSGKGPVCVIPTAGWGPSSELYFETMTEMEEYFTMVYLDTRGSGRSEKPASPQDYTYEQFTADFDALRQHFGLETMIMMGHSQGGMHAINYALHYPNHCTGLILLNTLPAFDEFYKNEMQKNMMLRENESWFGEAMAAFANENPCQSSEEFAEFIETILPFYFVDIEVSQNYGKKVSAATFSVEASKGQAAVQLEINLLDEVHKINIPTLLITGEEDFICPPIQSERIAERIENSKVIIIPNAGHFPWFEQKDDFYQSLVPAAREMNFIQ